LVVVELEQLETMIEETLELILFLVLHVHLLQQLAEVEVVQKTVPLPDVELLEVQVEVELQDVVLEQEPQEIVPLFPHL
tara:strand:+ start:44 stop:280 length:237 start_codon:yes stop_codon:yes gene_type:complete